MKCWDINKLLRSSYALAILNQEIGNPKGAIKLWKKADVRVLVDGGTNQWDKIKTNDSPLPDIISGDFDSIQPNILQQYNCKDHVQIISTPDQDYTDFTKSLMLINEKYPQQCESIFALVENSGRLDQTFGNIETLFHALKILPNKKIFIISSNTITWLLNSGHHKILIEDLIPKGSQNHVGLVPVGQKATCVTTSGLKWNLNQQELSFGNLVSTSNCFQEGSKEIHIQTETTILWTMEFKY